MWRRQQLANQETGEAWRDKCASLVRVTSSSYSTFVPMLPQFPHGLSSASFEERTSRTPVLVCWITRRHHHALTGLRISTVSQGTYSLPPDSPNIRCTMIVLQKASSVSTCRLVKYLFLLPPSLPQLAAMPAENRKSSSL